MLSKNDEVTNCSVCNIPHAAASATSCSGLTGMIAYASGAPFIASIGATLLCCPITFFGFIKMGERLQTDELAKIQSHDKK
jgi:hypothetical protein